MHRSIIHRSIIAAAVIVCIVSAVYAAGLNGDFVLTVASGSGGPNPPALSSPFVIIAAGTQPQLSTGGTAVACTTAGNDSTTAPFCGGGVTDDSACFNSAMNLGHDVQINAGHYCISSVHNSNGSVPAGFGIPTGRNVRCGSGTGSAADFANISMDYGTGASNFSISEIEGTATLFGCEFRGPNYLVSPHPLEQGGVTQAFISMPFSGSNATIANNDFEGIGGFLGAISAYGGSPPTPLLIEFNTSKDCGHYFTQLSGANGGAIITFDHNTLVDCNCCVEGTFNNTPAPNITISNGHSTYTKGTGWDWNSNNCCNQDYVDMQGESGATTNCDFSHSQLTNYICDGAARGDMYSHGSTACPAYSSSGLSVSGVCVLH